MLNPNLNATAVSGADPVPPTETGTGTERGFCAGQRSARQLSRQKQPDQKRPVSRQAGHECPVFGWSASVSHWPSFFGYEAHAVLEFFRDGETRPSPHPVVPSQAIPTPAPTSESRWKCHWPPFQAIQRWRSASRQTDFGRCKLKNSPLVMKHHGAPPPPR